MANDKTHTECNLCACHLCTIIKFLQHVCPNFCSFDLAMKRLCVILRDDNVRAITEVEKTLGDVSLPLSVDIELECSESP